MALLLAAVQRRMKVELVDRDVDPVLRPAGEPVRPLEPRVLDDDRLAGGRGEPERVGLDVGDHHPAVVPGDQPRAGRALGVGLDAGGELLGRERRV